MVYHEICSHKWSGILIWCEHILGGEISNPSCTRCINPLGPHLFRKKQVGPSNMTVLSKGANVLPSCSLTFYHDTTPSLRVVH